MCLRLQENQAVMCVMKPTETQVKEKPSALLWLVPLFWFCVPFPFSSQLDHFSYQPRTFLWAGLDACGGEIELQALGLRS